MARSRRKAREAALRALYEIDLGRSAGADALEFARVDMELPEDQLAFAQRVVGGVAERQTEIDDRLANLIRDFDFDRVAAIDRNVLRLATYELLFEPAIPPRVSINEAVELAKLYSTAESGRFVNGVLGRLLLSTPKSSWDSSAAPAEEEFMEQSEPEVEMVQADSEEAVAARKLGWTVRTDDGKHS